MAASTNPRDAEDGALDALGEMPDASILPTASQGTDLGPDLEKERARLASEIHDGLTQAVATAILELEILEKVIERDPHEAIEMLAEARAELRDSMAELRSILFDLQGDHAEVPEVPLTAFIADVVRRWRLEAKISVSGDMTKAPKPTRSVAYLVVREGVSNAAKHSGTRNVSVRIRTTPSEVAVAIEDPGRGFRPSDQPSKHFGMRMLERRVAEVDGTLEVSSSSSGGTRVSARLPIGGTR
jgi:signal transduction histidine kinase